MTVHFLQGGGGGFKPEVAGRPHQLLGGHLAQRPAQVPGQLAQGELVNHLASTRFTV